jgi:Na+-translocating ferredoxin:NAD+ oxidoreductase RNF subunit RnfB
MEKIPTPMDRRRFLKHLGILGVAGVLGMGIGEIFSPTESDLIDAAADAEIAKRRKFIWASKEDADIGDPDNAVSDAKSGGFPFVNRRVCAYHLPNQATGEYEDITDDNQQEVHFCSAPCVDVCPVDAIRLRKTPENRTMPGFPQKKDSDRYSDLDRDWGDPRKITGCIGCQKCFKMCGYDTIQWVNP